MTDSAASQLILVVDDAIDIRDMLREVLEAEGYGVATAANGLEALRAVYQSRPALVISDIAMPEMDGWVFLTRLREFSETPVIMLSALGEERDKVRGLRDGADDYVVKPVMRAELLARVEALLRRARSEETEEVAAYHDAVLYLDFERHDVRVRGQPVELSPQEFRLLTALIRHPGAVLSPDRLLELAWGTSEGGPENVRVYIGYLRRKLEPQPGVPPMIQTVRGFGYRFNAHRS